MKNLSDKVVLITGGARGIGAETAKALVAAGARVVLTDVDEAALSETAAGLDADRVLAVACDVVDLASMEDAVAQAVARFGGIDLVLANAGIASYGSVLGVDPATFRRVVDINITGVFHTVRAALPSVIERKGYILVVSSLAAFTPVPGLAAYNASKAGVEHFANALRLEVAHQGVEVGIAHMSWIDTPLVRDAKKDLSAFRKMLDLMPYPLNQTTSVDACVDGFVKGLAGRKRRVFVPGWVGAIGKGRALLVSPLVDREMVKHTATLLPQMDEEVRRLGRSTSARNQVPAD
ncbi:SDR family oxidoreductase [Nocardioides sp. AE5]|uniref:SDR family oxidoreductase n=1 Tax=Nocardioides sp. AE5 TaxID=2962573 RepID=UPI002881C59F|nr:SDR family oxidoreductase [Nocardioides sp. AE5]MDT0200934.1 SDR family oxidoreductase [Nocardioides sp. AE5]